MAIAMPSQCLPHDIVVSRGQDSKAGAKVLLFFDICKFLVDFFKKIYSLPRERLLHGMGYPFGIHWGGVGEGAGKAGGALCVFWTILRRRWKGRKGWGNLSVFSLYALFSITFRT